MILVILGIGLAMLIPGIILWAIQSHDRNNKIRHWIYNNECSYIVPIVIGALISIITICAIIGLGIECSSEKAIDTKIQLYQEENASIENTVAQIVNDYQTYEQDTFKEFKQEDVMVAVNLYPELKSNELVVKQLEIHAENNSKIKSLKSEKADLTTSKWWLYFGE